MAGPRGARGRLADNSQMRFEATIEKRGSGHMLEIPFDVKA
jgi:hypothetical protein